MNSSTNPKMIAMISVEITPAMYAPISAPMVVAISRSIPTRTLVYPSRT